MFTQIPKVRPATPLLDKIDSPKDLRKIDAERLPELAKQLRAFMLFSVGQTGGHFGAGLGVIELTIALHRIFNTPYDRLIWDVGHQAYPHKILTGRREKMQTLRQKDGICAFPNRNESPFDAFGVGHSSTSISAALGMAIAARHKQEKRHCIAVIGDGALTAGMAFEALNHAAHEKANLLVILNDNDMSISRSSGGLSSYLAKLLSSSAYHNVRENSKKILAHLPNKARELVRKTEEHFKGMVVPGTLFEELGFNYIGPIDGHNINDLVQTLSNMQNLQGPQFLHIVTKKGKGFAPAESDPIGYHAITKFENKAISKKENLCKKFSEVFGNWLCTMADTDNKLLGITPAMKEGSGMVAFAENYPDRYFDVAICEQHAVTLAAGMACEGLKPVVAIYSTFLQRGYDQLIHDICLQGLDVLFAIDRAGLVGEDGPTHAGCYDIAYLRCLPDILIMAPADEAETWKLLSTGYLHNGPAAVRYPRGVGIGTKIDTSLVPLPIGKAEIRKKGSKVAILAFGTLLYNTLELAEKNNFTLVNMRFIKPLDAELILKLSQEHSLLVTLEENSIAAGAGSAVNELLAKHNIQIQCLNLGIIDRFIEHGKPNELLQESKLDKKSIEQAIDSALAKA